MFLFMEIFFNTQKIKTLCNHQRALKKLGTDGGNSLKQRLTQLHSVEELGGFKFDNPHPLQGTKKSQFAITICAGLRLVFKAIEPKKADDGSILWQQVTKINIIFIGDYHE
jgi:hypothetical protein